MKKASKLDKRLIIIVCHHPCLHNRIKNSFLLIGWSNNNSSKLIQVIKRSILLFTLCLFVGNYRLFSIILSSNNRTSSTCVAAAARPKTRTTTLVPDWSIREIVDLRSPFPDQSELRMSDSSCTIFIRLNKCGIVLALVVNFVLRRAIH